MDSDGGGNRRVYKRPGIDSSKNQKVCFHWRACKCTRFPCPFLHSEPAYPSGYAASATGNGSGTPKRFADDCGFSGQLPRRSPNFKNKHNNSCGRMGANKVVRKTEKVCNFWVRGNCSYGDKCKLLHSWSLGEGFNMLNHLDGHQKLVSGIVLPAGMDKLFTGSKDETLRVWDTNSGQCTGVINLGGEVGCMIGEGPWLFVGIPNDVKEGILIWKFNAVTNTFEPAASLKGHTLPVVSLIVGANRLYSGSMDHSIKVWSLENLQCIQTLTEHNDVVMSFLWWDKFLLSCSLDKTINVWVTTENGNLEVTYTHNEENGVLNLRGMTDLESKPVLLCACNDSYVRLFDLPSFSERGKIFAKQGI